MLVRLFPFFSNFILESIFAPPAPLLNCPFMDRVLHFFPLAARFLLSYFYHTLYFLSSAVHTAKHFTQSTVCTRCVQCKTPKKMNKVKSAGVLHEELKAFSWPWHFFTCFIIRPVGFIICTVGFIIRTIGFIIHPVGFIIRTIGFIIRIVGSIICTVGFIFRTVGQLKSFYSASRHSY